MDVKKIEIMWDDLTEGKQREIIDMFGDNCNFDAFPIAILEVCGEESENVAMGQAQCL
ncbi:MAG: hypothetical protein LBO70_04950 [Clostridiales Family XIII bacterium]|jgi:hypothetical protein|nr:hypothetical protein [Clostridiales Family XIII bacterium]